MAFKPVSCYRVLRTCISSCEIFQLQPIFIWICMVCACYRSNSAFQLTVWKSFKLLKEVITLCCLKVWFKFTIHKLYFKNLFPIFSVCYINESNK